jgi:hypothetical protein
MKRNRTITVLAVTGAIGLAAPAAAEAVGAPASNPTAAQYGDPGRGVGGGSDAGEGLAFTGLDVAGLALAAVGLLGGGVIVRRLGRATPEER